MKTRKWDATVPELDASFCNMCIDKDDIMEAAEPVGKVPIGSFDLDLRKDFSIRKEDSFQIEKYKFKTDFLPKVKFKKHNFNNII